jgi:hypothetical protein
LNVARPRALRVRYTGPVTPINTGKVTIMETVPFTTLSVLQGRGPDRGAATSVAKPVAAFAIVRATALRHVRRPGPRRKIVCDVLVERRTHDARTWLLHVGERRRVLRKRWRCRRLHRRGRTIGWRRRCRRIWVRMLDAPSPRRFVARTGDQASKTHRGSEPNEKDSSPRPIHLRPHGHWHDGLKLPGPPMPRTPSVNGDRP